jgi:hypothetical protein
MTQKKTRASRMAPILGICIAAVAAGITGSAVAAPTTTRVIVAYKSGAAARIKAAVAAANGTVKHEIFRMDAMAVEVPNAALKGLENNPLVDYIEEDVLRKPLSLTTPSTGTPYQTGQLVPYGIKLVQADQLSDSNASNRKVCIIDSGMDNSHEDLAGNNVTGEYDSGTGW